MPLAWWRVQMSGKISYIPPNVLNWKSDYYPLETERSAVGSVLDFFGGQVSALINWLQENPNPQKFRKYYH